MRVLGFSREWPKLKNQIFTTFRFSRKDRDWQVDEVVQIVLHPRSKLRKVLGNARIVGKGPHCILTGRIDGNFYPLITRHEAIEDGFEDFESMRDWLIKTYGEEKLRKKPINKLTLTWV